MVPTPKDGIHEVGSFRFSFGLLLVHIFINKLDGVLRDHNFEVDWITPNVQGTPEKI